MVFCRPNHQVTFDPSSWLVHPVLLPYWITHSLSYYSSVSQMTNLISQSFKDNILPCSLQYSNLYALKWCPVYASTRVWHTGTGIFSFFCGIATGIGTNWYRKKSRNRYRKNLVPGKSLGTGIGTIWYRKKVSEPVSEKFDTGTEFRCQNLGILKIYNGYRYRIGTGTENFSFFKKIGTGKKSQNRYRNFFIPELIFVAKT